MSTCTRLDRAPRRRLLVAACCLLSTAWSIRLSAQSAPGNTATGAVAQSGAAMVVSIVTVGQGDLIWEKFGHNSLRFHDTTSASSLDVVFNWGLFDPRARDFMARFLAGRMRYAMGSEPAEPFITYYTRRDRHVWEQVLNLSDAEKVHLLELATENEKPQNRFYDYNYYLDNCSTRVRDILDRVLNGQLRAATDSAATGTTFREHTRRLLTDDPSAYFGIQLVLGHPADRPISKWEEMFLPVRMLHALSDVMVTNANGEMRALVSEEMVLAIPTRRAAEAAVLRRHTPGYLVTGVVIAMLLLFFARRGSAGRRAHRRIFALGAAAWCLFAGGAGTLALAMWLFSQHTFMYDNETVLLMNPALILLVVTGPMAALSGSWRRTSAAIAAFVMAMTVLGTLFWIAPGLGQANGEMVALTLPVSLALFLAFRLLSRNPPAAAGAAAGVLSEGGNPELMREAAA